MSKIIQQGERQLVEIPLTLDVGSISGSKKISTPFPAGYIAVLNNSAATLYYKRGEYLGSTPPADAVQVQPSTYLSLPIEEDTKYTFFWSSTVALTQSNNQAMILFSNEEIYMQANNLTTGGVASNVAVTNTPNVGIINGANSLAVNTDGSLNSTLTGSNALSATVVTPNDTNNLAKVPTKGLYVGVGGDVKVDMSDGATITFSSLSAGIVHPLAVKKVYATGTTATNIVAVY